MVTLRILGECAIEVGSTRLAPDSQVLFATLLYLTLEPGRRVSRQEMADAIWPGATEEAARHNLRQTVYRLRLLGATIDTKDGFVCAPPEGVVAPHDRLATEAGVDEILSHAAPRIGTVLPGYESGLSERLDEWVDGHRTLIHNRIRHSLVTAMERYRARARWGEVEVLARKVLAMDPLNEEATLVLAESAAMSGSKHYALTLLDRYISELGPEAKDIHLPAKVLRRRISERLPEPRWRAVSETALVGRADSMEMLGGVLQAARNGDGSGVLLWGEPGIGKTRLAEELWKVAALQANTQLAKVSCQPSDARRPLSLFADVIPALQKLPGALGCSPRSITLLKRLTEYDVNAEGPSEDAREADYLYASIRRAIYDLFDAIQVDQCVVLVIEDVHWLDTESWKILREMIPWAARRRLLFVMTSRDPFVAGDEHGEWPRFLVKHKVGPIDPDAGITLAELMVREKEREPDVAFRDWSIAVSEGNPFFLRELIAYWLQTGTAYQVPETMAALINARLDRISRSALSLLQAICILGPNATLERLELMLQLPHHEMLAAAEVLESSGLMVASGEALAARHHLISHSALRRLGTIARQFLHRRAAVTLERECTGASLQLVWDCASHWEAAGNVPRSTAYPIATARHLIEVGLPHQAIDILDRLSSATVDAEARIEVLAELGHAHCIAGNWHEAIRSLSSSKSLRSARTGVVLSLSPEDPLLLEARSQAGVGRDELLAEAIDLLRRPNAPPPLALEVADHAIMLADSCADVRQMQYVYRHVEGIQADRPEDRAILEHVRVVYHSACGDPRTALESAERFDDLTENCGGSAVARIRARMTLARAQYRCGLFSAAMATAQQSDDVAAANGLAALRVPALVAMGNWYTAARLLDGSAAALALAEANLDTSNQRAWVEEIAFARARLALARRDSITARQLLHSFKDRLLCDPVLRRRLHIQAAWIETLLVEQVLDPEDALFLAFEKLLDRAKDTGNVDYPAAVYTRALLAVGQETNARAFLLQFLASHRREVGPPTKELALLCPRSQLEA